MDENGAAPRHTDLAAQTDRRRVLRAGVLTGIGALVVGAGMVAAGPVSAATRNQEGWRWCSKCKGLYFALNGTAGRCPAGSGHNDGGISLFYALTDEIPPAPDLHTQNNWRWCMNCQGLSYAGNRVGSCPGLGTHVYGTSRDYHLRHDVSHTFPDEQPHWQWCGKCEGLFYGLHEAQSWCRSGAGQRHVAGVPNTIKSFNYVLHFTPRTG